MKNGNKFELTTHEENILRSMKANTVYSHKGGYGVPYHTLPNCQQGIHSETVVRLVDSGYLVGLGKQAYVFDGKEHVHGYDAVLKVRDLNAERKAALIAEFKKFLPPEDVVYARHTGTTMLVVTYSREHGRLHVYNAVGIGNGPDGKPFGKIDVVTAYDCQITRRRRRMA